MVESVSDVSPSLIGFFLAILIGPNLGFDGRPVHINILGIFEELWIVFLLSLTLKESLSVSNYSIDMGPVLCSDLESPIPLVELDIQLDCTIVESSCKENLLSLLNLFAIKGQCSVSRGLRRQLFDVIDKLNFISFINGC